MENNNFAYDQEMEIDLKELFFALLKKWKVIIASAIFCALLGMCASMFLMADTYVSKTSVYVISMQEGATNYSNLQTGAMMTSDYEVLVKGRTVLEKVIEKLDLNMKYETLKGMVSVSVPDSTRIVEISVSSTDPYLSQDIANAVREISSETILEVMGVGEVNTVEVANLPEHKASPSVSRNTILGGMLGGVLACGIVAMLFILDDTIRTQDDIERYLGLSTIGSIPKDRNLEKDERRRRKAQKSMSNSTKKAKA